MNSRVHGFTLLETVIVTGIIAFSIGALALLYVNFNTVLGTGASVKTAALDAARVVREAELLVGPARAVLSSRAFGTTTYSSSASTLVLEIPSVNAAGTVIPSTYDYAVIHQTGSTTLRILEANTASSRVSGTKKLAGSLMSLAFTYDNATYSLVESLDLEVRTVVIARGKRNAAHLTGSWKLKNHP